ncbi:MAG: helix-turn-helix domain-containing protein [Rubrobacter sp.]
MITKNYGPEDKARALAGLLCGERVRVVSRQHGIPEGTVKSWRHRLKTGRMQPEKKGRAGGLLLEHTRALLRSLIVQGGHPSDPERIREVPAKELAIFWGTLFDRTMRMLELYPALSGESRGVPRGESGYRGEGVR